MLIPIYNGFAIQRRRSQLLFGSRIIYSKQLEFKLSLLGKEIISGQSVKDLGIIFDPTISFDNYISTTVSSCVLNLSQISCIRFLFFNKRLLETIIKGTAGSR